MVQNNMDSRVRRTKRLLREGLTKLLQEKSIKKITVRELSDCVEINRGTFYLHYKDIYDLVSQIEDELFDEFEGIVDNYSFKDLKTRPEDIFLDICRFLFKNREICAALLGDNGDITFLFKMRDFLRKKCLTDYVSNYSVSHLEHYEYVYTFFEAGTVGLLRHWLENAEDGRTPEEVASLIESIFKSGVSFLLDFDKQYEAKKHV